MPNTPLSLPMDPSKSPGVALTRTATVSSIVAAQLYAVVRSTTYIELTRTRSLDRLDGVSTSTENSIESYA